MNELDLRLKYKSETGYLPTYGKYNYNDYGGALNHYYAEWLENLGRGYRYKQDKYLSETHKLPTYINCNNRYTYYYQEYKEWLEEDVLKYIEWLDERNIPMKWR